VVGGIHGYRNHKDDCISKWTKYFDFVSEKDIDI
jgi:hypothetical protein